jgi:hypothetical protein
LDRDFEESEVLEVVRNFNGDKRTLWKCWEVLKEDIMEVFKEFHRRGKFKWWCV